jgi:hypothetical protein
MLLFGLVQTNSLYKKDAQGSINNGQEAAVWLAVRKFAVNVVMIGNLRPLMIALSPVRLVFSARITKVMLRRS